MAHALLCLHHPMRGKQPVHGLYKASKFTHQASQERKSRQIHENAPTQEGGPRRRIQVQSRSNEKRKKNQKANPHPKTQASAQTNQASQSLQDCVISLLTIGDVLQKKIFVYDIDESKKRKIARTRHKCTAHDCS
jgi:hypothetical protein